MELAPDTRQFAKYSPTSTPVLDALRAPSRKRDRISAHDYFFLSSAVILTLIAWPWLNRVAASISSPSTPRFQAIGITVLVIPAVALAAAVGVHEAGHLLTAWLQGFRLAKNTAPLFSCQAFQPGLFSFELIAEDHLSRRLFLVVSGGPAASLLAPLILEPAVYLSRARLLPAFAVHVFSALSVLLGASELLPGAGRGNFSDGARMLMLLRNDSAGQRWLSILHMQRALSRGEHPKNWDEGRVTTATAMQDDSRDAVNARWLGYLWAMERQDITAAAKYLEDALAAPALSATGLGDRLFLEAAAFQAWFRGDSEKARFWSSQIRERKLGELLRIRLNIALLWSDGKLFDAWEKLEDCFQMLKAAPPSPERDLMAQSASEWKAQMESRMLTRAWRAMYAMAEPVELAAQETSR